MLTRAHQRIVERRLCRAPAVALLGPRQVGKTTLARSLSRVYFDLEQDEERLRLDVEWSTRTSGADLVVLDEAQAWPDLFNRLRGAIDQDRSRKGRFLLLGSVSPNLMHHVSESLAGRMSLVELTPFLLSELPTRLDDLWFYGGYPEGGILDPEQFPRWQTDYLTLLSQRDLPTWGLSARPQTTDRLIKILSASHGQMLNASQLGQSLGLSHNTVRSYLDYLVGAFLIRLLPPLEANLRKRLVKTPRVYWRDSGVVHALLRVLDFEDLLVQPWVGASWEGFVVEQIIGLFSSLDHRVDPYFFRTSDGHELDLVIEGTKERWAFEIKLTSRPTADDMRRLRKAADLLGADRRFLISRVEEAASGEGDLSCSLPHFVDLMARDKRLP